MTSPVLPLLPSDLDSHGTVESGLYEMAILVIATSIWLVNDSNGRLVEVFPRKKKIKLPWPETKFKLMHSKIPHIGPSSRMVPAIA